MKQKRLITTLTFFLCVFFSTTNHAAATSGSITTPNASPCSDMRGITAPSSQHGSPYYIPPEAICFNGKDYTKKIKSYEDDVITGAFSVNGDGDAYFVSIYSDKEEHGRILIILTDGVKLWKEILYQNIPHVSISKPENSVDNITINAYDADSGILYYTTDAYAQASMVHALHVNNGGRVYSEPLHDGTFKGIDHGHPIVSTIRHDDKGAYFPAYLFDKKGNILCLIDTRTQLWEISPTCLTKNDTYRER